MRYTALILSFILLFISSSHASSFNRKGAIARTVKIYRAGLNGEPSFSGSGVYIDKGTIMTAGHVCVDGVKSIEFALDGELYNGPIAIKFSEDAPDICIVKTKLERRFLKPLKLGKEIDINTKAPIYILGYPENWFTLERGRIVAERHFSREKVLFMLDRGAMPGISGGPAFYEDGSLAGLVIAMVIWQNGRDHGSALIEGMQSIKPWLKKEGIKYVE